MGPKSCTASTAVTFCPMAGCTLKRVSVQKFWLNVQLSLVLASFWVLWLLPVGVAVCIFVLLNRARNTWGAEQFAEASVIALALAAFLWITLRLRSAWQAIPAELKPTEPPGKPLQESDAPELFALAQRLRQQTGIGKTVEVWSDLSPVVSAVAYAAHLAAETKIALRNGLVALAVLSRAQLETLLRYHLTILTFSPRLISMLLKARMVAHGTYFLPYTIAFDSNLRKVERYARKRATGDLAQATAAIELSQEAGRQFELFWATDMQMFLQTGHLMPIAEGFARHWRRLRSETGESIVPEQDLALGMLRSPNTVEGRLTAGLLQQNQNLERTQWEQGGVILLRTWESSVDARAEALTGLTAGGLCELVRQGAVELGSRIFENPGRPHEPEELRLWTSQVLAMALAVALHRTGWQFLYTGAGCKMEFGKQELRLAPFTAIQAMLTGKTECAEWSAICEQRGISKLLLSSASQT